MSDGRCQGRESSGRSLPGPVVLLLGLGVLSSAACRPGPSAGTRVDLLSAEGGLRSPEGATQAPARGGGAATWGFEQGDAPADTGWGLTVHRGTARALLAASAAEGERCLCLESGAEPTDALVNVAVPARPQRKYLLRALLKTSASGAGAAVDGRLQVGEYGAAPDGTAARPALLRWHRDLADRTGETGWKAVTLAFATRPETRSLSVVASLTNWGAVAGRVCVDGVSLTDLGPAGAVSDDLRLGGESRRALPVALASERRARVTVPAGGRLSFATGVLPPPTARGAGDVTFEVSVEDESGPHAVHRSTVPAGGRATAAWTDEEVDLRPFEGRKVDLVFRTRGTAPGAADEPRAAWAHPVVWSPARGAGGAAGIDVVLVTVDTLRPDHLACYGHSRPTSPAIDAFAERGILFENAFTVLPRTTPALASLLTGLEPRRHGLMTLIDSLRDDAITVAEVLRARGHATAAFVTPNVPQTSRLNRGFDVFADHADLPRPLSRADHVARRAARWLAGQDGRRVFLWLHLWDPHFRYTPPPPHDRAFVPEPPVPFDLYERLDSGALTRGAAHFRSDLSPAQVEHAIGLYDGEVAFTDTVVGAFLGELERLDRLDDALVIFAADHGESLGEHGYHFEHGDYLYDACLRIPLLVKLPGSREAGTRFSGLVSITDVAATVLAATGATVPEGVAGRDLARMVAGDLPAHEALFHETGRRFLAENVRRPIPGPPGNWKAVRRGRFKLIQLPGVAGDAFELYDVVADPHEENDLFRPDHLAVPDLARALAGWLEGFDSVATAEPALDADTQERLRSLGYLD